MQMALRIAALIIANLARLCSGGETNDIPRIIPAIEAKEMVGSTVIVTGKVVEVYISEKVVRVNLDRSFPRQPFTAVIFANRTNLFSDLRGLEGKPVAVRGKITEYRNRPEIVINSTNQLRVLAP